MTEGGRNMTVQGCYEMMDGDYTGVIGRLLKDERIQKYLLKFLDAKDYQEMTEALEQENYEVAFRASHTLKGLSLNLGFTGLQRTSEELCEALRGGKPDIDIAPLVSAVGEEYEKVISAIKAL
jgi:HPt (histidine-containing phosphotransfer) domain-containing protein